MPILKPTLLSVLSLWFTFALMVAIPVITRSFIGGMWLGLLVFGALCQLWLAIRCTLCYRRGRMFPCEGRPEGAAGFARRERVRARMTGGGSPR